MNKNEGAVIVAMNTVFECIMEKKFYNVKDSKPHFIQVHTTFNVVAGPISGGKGQLSPVMHLLPVCENCFKNPDYHFEMPEESTKMTYDRPMGKEKERPNFKN